VLLEILQSQAQDSQLLIPLVSTQQELLLVLLEQLRLNQLLAVLQQLQSVQQ